MHEVEVRALALDLLELGLTRRDVCRIVGVGYNSTYRWQRRLEPPRRDVSRCPLCRGQLPPAAPYTYLLGQYLGDGHIAALPRTTALRIYCCDAYPGIRQEVADAISAVIGNSVNYRQLPGCTQVQSSTNHWLCLFPQHGPGHKHERKIELADWQWDLIRADPRPLIRGLIHSDGCRALNTIYHDLPSGRRTYQYPRYLFSNVSTDIQGIFTDALDLLGIAWRRNRWNSISVARREAVAAMDAFVGPKF
jgi:hypothetical protein